MANIYDLMNSASENAISKAAVGKREARDLDMQMYNQHEGKIKSRNGQLVDSYNEALHPDAEFDTSDEDFAAPVQGVDLNDPLVQRLLLNSDAAREPVDAGKKLMKRPDMSDPAYRSILEETIRRQRGPEKRS